MRRADANLVLMREDSESEWVVRLLDSLRYLPDPDDCAVSPGELRALQGYAVGLSAAEIAAVHGVSERTITTQTERARRKLRAKNTTHAVVLALLSGLLNAAQLREAVSPHSERTD
jgi:DNA-binding CsgD family transcriptional regulator